MASIMFAVFFAVVVQSLQEGVYGFMIESVVGKFSGYVQVHQEGYWDEQIIDNSMQHDEALVLQLSEAKGVDQVYPRLEGFALGANDELTKGAMVLGVDFQKELKMMELNERLVAGEIPSSSSEGVVIGERFANFFDYSIGDSLILIGQGYHGASATGLYRIEGIVHMLNPMLDNSLVMMNLASAQWFYAADQLVSTYVIGLSDSYQQRTAFKSVAAELPDGYEVMEWETMMPDLVQMIEADQGGGVIMLLILYMIISFGMFGTVLMMTQERRHEFGILISVGMKRIKLMGIVLIETVLLGLLGVLMGLAIAFPLNLYLYRNPIDLSGGGAGDAYEQYGFEPLMPASMNPSIPLVNTLFILAIALLISIWPIVSVGRMKVVEAMKS